MGFSSTLQGKAAHEALLLRQDAELRLLDTMKRCLLQKSKCDKEYSVALATVAQQGLKSDRADELQGNFYLFIKFIETVKEGRGNEFCFFKLRKPQRRLKTNKN